MGFTEFIAGTSGAMHVPSTAGSPIPIQMPSGIQAGDLLNVFMSNGHVNPVSGSSVPSGWRGVLSTGFYWKVADGSEDGAVINWQTQDTTFVGAEDRVLVWSALCHRTTVAPLLDVNGDPDHFIHDDDISTSTSASVIDPPGTGGSRGFVGSTQLRVYAAFGEAYTDPFDGSTGTPISSVSWVNAIERTGLVTLASVATLNDSLGQATASIEYNFPPPFAVYQPHDSVTVFGPNPGMTLETAVWHFPGYWLADYWGILATP
jgi:hypothetical protein